MSLLQHLPPLRNENISYEKLIKTVNLIFFPLIIWMVSISDKSLISYFSFPSDCHLVTQKRFLEESSNKTGNTKCYLDDDGKRFFSLMNNIKSKAYIGRWNSIENVEELNNSGEIQLRIIDGGFQSNKMAINYQLIIILKEAEYLDKFITYYFNLTYKHNFDFNQKNNTIISNETNGINAFYSYFKNQRISYSKYSLFIQLNIDEMNNVISKMRGKITYRNYIFEFNVEEIKLDYFSHQLSKVRNLSLALTFIAAVHLLHSLYIAKKINNELNYTKKLSLFTFCLDVLWNSVLCVVCSYISFYYNTFFKNELLLPAVIYFANVCLLQLRIVFIILRNNFLINYDEFSIRRMILRFYILYYIILYVNVVFSYEIFFNDYVLFGIITLTWIPQIYINAYYCRGTVNLFSLLIISVNKMFVPLYIWYCPYNLLQIKTNSRLCQALIISMIIQVKFFTHKIIVIVMQILFGPRCLIPWFLRKKEYNYFRTQEELQKEIPNFETQTCPICLVGFSLSQSQEDDFNYNTNACTRCCIRIQISINNCYKNCTNGEKSKPLMFTPCKHIFHSNCLQLWLETNLVCPICREALPHLQ